MFSSVPESQSSIPESSDLIQHCYPALFPSSMLYASACLINVIPVGLRINLCEAGSQWLQNKPVLLNCWMEEAWQSYRKQRSMDLEGRRRGVTVHFFFFFLLMQRSAAAATVGSPVGKYQQHYEVGLSLPSLSMRGRGPSEHTKGEKTQSQTKNNARDGGKERGKKRERETTHKKARDGQREGLKSIPVRNGGDSAGKS